MPSFFIILLLVVASRFDGGEGAAAAARPTVSDAEDRLNVSGGDGSDAEDRLNVSGGDGAAADHPTVSDAADRLYALLQDIQQMERLLNTLETVLDDVVPVTTTTPAPPDNPSLRTEPQPEQRSPPETYVLDTSENWRSDSAIGMARTIAIGHDIPWKHADTPETAAVADTDCSMIKSDLYYILVYSALALDEITANVHNVSDTLIPSLNTALGVSCKCISANKVPLSTDDKSWLIASVVSVETHVAPAKSTVAAALHPPSPVHGLTVDSAYMVLLIVFCCLVAAVLFSGIACLLYKTHSTQRRELASLRRRTTRKARAAGRRAADNRRTPHHRPGSGVSALPAGAGRAEHNSGFYSEGEYPPYDDTLLAPSRRSGDWVKRPGPYSGWVSVRDRDDRHSGGSAPTADRPARAAHARY